MRRRALRGARAVDNLLSLAVLICDARRSGGAHAAVAEAAEHCAQAYAANVTSGQSRQTGPTGAVCLIKDPTPS